MISAQHTHQPQPKQSSLRIAVSACLLGHEVRYDGTHKAHAFVTETLNQHLTLIPVCPEVEIGMGVPRLPIHLVEQNGELRALGVTDQSLDVTGQLTQYGEDTAARLQDIDGYIFKTRSPSCGLWSTPVNTNAADSKIGSGLFAEQIMQCLPLLPVIEETRLETVAQQMNFLQWVAAYRRWRDFEATFPTWNELLAFHQSNRFVLQVHSSREWQRMTAWLRDFKHVTETALENSLLSDYAKRYLACFARPATRRRHGQVLQLLWLSLHDQLPVEEQVSLQRVIAKYQQAQVPLLTVIESFRTGLDVHQISATSELCNYLDINVKLLTIYNQFK